MLGLTAFLLTRSNQCTCLCYTDRHTHAKRRRTRPKLGEKAEVLHRQFLKQRLAPPNNRLSRDYHNDARHDSRVTEDARVARLPPRLRTASFASRVNRASPSRLSHHGSQPDIVFWHQTPPIFSRALSQHLNGNSRVSSSFTFLWQRSG